MQGTATLSAAPERPDTRHAMVRTSVMAGLIGGTIWMVLASVAAAAGGDGFWQPVRLAATVAGVPMGDGFSMLALILGTGMHLVLAGLFAAGFVAIAQPFAWTSDGAIEFAGAAYGGLVYVVNFHVLSTIPFLSAFSAVAGDPMWVALHIVYGLVVASMVLAARDRYLFPNSG